MALPTNRADFKEHVLENLGKGAIVINVTDKQIENRLDQAINYFWEFHGEGSQRIYHFHEISQTDIDNGYIIVPDSILSITQVVSQNREFLSGDSSGTSDPLFNFAYQFRNREMWMYGGMTMSYMYVMQNYMEEMRRMFNPVPSTDYSRLSNRLYIRANWGGTSYQVGNIVVVDGFEALNPEEFPRIFTSIGLIDLATAYIKLQWAENVGKYANVELPGGIMLNGEEMYRRATEEIEKIKGEIDTKYSPPPRFMIC